MTFQLGRLGRRVNDEGGASLRVILVVLVILLGENFWILGGEGVVLVFFGHIDHF